MIILAGFIKFYTIERISLLGAFGNKACLFLNVIACIADDYTVHVLKKTLIKHTRNRHTPKRIRYSIASGTERSFAAVVDTHR